LAEFKVHSMEGTQYVDVHLNNESFRAEAGALCYFVGDVSVKSKLLPSVGGILRALMADEKIYRPTYTGTGIVTLESSLGGFHILDLANESWILEPGTYWASDEGVNVSFHRERIATAFWAGEGLIYLQTKVSGTGKVVVTTRGPVEMIQLEKGKKVAVEGNSVICRSADVSFKIGRASKGYIGAVTSGEGRIRIYEGTGTILLNPSPYWRYKIAQDRATSQATGGLE
jgi:uncharacterized protein (AIM24 family)